MAGEQRMTTKRTSLEPTVHAPAEPRRFLRQALSDWHADALCPAAELLTSELVSNVVRHAMTTIELDVSWADQRLRVGIADGSSIVPAVADAARADGGLGLRIVDSFADEWGIDDRPDGKVVWFSLTESAET